MGAELTAFPNWCTWPVRWALEAPARLSVPRGLLLLKRPRRGSEREPLHKSELLQKIYGRRARCEGGSLETGAAP